MKAYFDGAGNLVIEAENHAERVALRMWQYINISEDVSANELFDAEAFCLKVSDGDA